MEHKHAERRLWLSAGGNLLLAVIEVIYGIWSGSITLVLEAGHNGVDVLTLTLSAVTTHKVRSNHSKLAALVGLVNVITLNLWVAYTLLEAIHRLVYPRPVEIRPFFVLGVVSLVLNLAMGVLLHGRHHGLHVHSASMHLLADAAGTIAFFVAGALITWTGMSQWDSIVSILLGFGIALTTLPLARECIHAIRFK